MKIHILLSTTLAFSSICIPSYARSLRAAGNNARRELEESKNSRIIGGSEAIPNKYPYAVSLQDDKGHFCGGSLIAKDVILSAAHCQGGKYKAVLGRHDLDGNDGQVISMETELSHPNYNKVTTDNDFMLVYLSQPATLNSDVSLVTLNSDESVPREGGPVTVMGYGDTHISDSISTLSDVLMKVEVSVISNSVCDNSSDGQDNYHGQITDNMLCARANGQDSCQGDSGGPLVITENGGDIQVGVVSWGISCAHKNFPGVYARVSKAYSWIESEVCANSQYATEAGFDCSNASYDPVQTAQTSTSYNLAPSGSSSSGGNNKPPSVSGGNNNHWDDYYYYDDDWEPSSSGNNGGNWNNGDNWSYSSSSSNGGSWDDDDDWYYPSSSGGWDDDWYKQ